MTFSTLAGFRFGFAPISLENDHGEASAGSSRSSSHGSGHSGAQPRDVQGADVVGKEWNDQVLSAGTSQSCLLVEHLLVDSSLTPVLHSGVVIAPA